MKVIIVSKTKVKNGVCVGGINIDSKDSLRLLESTGKYPPADTDYEIGRVFEMTYKKPSWPVEPPHVEDVIVQSKKLLMEQSDLANYLSSTLKVPCWNGKPETMFGGSLSVTTWGKGFLDATANMPAVSTGFWISDQDLTLEFDNNGKPFYRYPAWFGVRLMPYVGLDAPEKVLSAGTLLRISLARWWPKEPEADQRCYLQLSGWYT